MSNFDSNIFFVSRLGTRDFLIRSGVFAIPIEHIAGFSPGAGGSDVTMDVIRWKDAISGKVCVYTLSQDERESLRILFERKEV